MSRETTEISPNDPAGEIDPGMLSSLWADRVSRMSVAPDRLF